MYDSQIGRDVRLSFQALAANATAFSESDADLLRRRICAAVDDLKSQGWPVEKIIVRVKELAQEVGLRLGHNMNQADNHPVLAKAVLWCVERYYGSERPADRDSSRAPMNEKPASH